MSAIPKIIIENPYRVLGVYANSKRQEVLANKSKATAFLKVNRAVDYPLDLKGILPQLTRTVDSMNKADAHLAIAKEQIKYAQFWFIKITTIDDVAFNHLLAGNMDEAISIWSEQNNLSSMQNRMVCYFIKRNLTQALILAEQLYVKYGSDYISQVDSSSTVLMSRNELIKQYIDSLWSEIDSIVLYKHVVNREWKDYISNRATEPLVNKILQEVNEAKGIDHSNPILRKEAAQNLVINTKEPFNQLKELLASDNPQLQMIADKLGLEILQCGIDYYNNADEDDAERNAMWIQKYASSIVIGTLAKQRCEENIKTLQKIIEELPPKEVITEHKEIMSLFANYSKQQNNISAAIKLLNDTTQYLQSIKNKLGKKNDYYLKVSTLVVSKVLNKIIIDVNASQKPTPERIGGFIYDTPSFMLSPEQKQRMLVRVKNTVGYAWEAIKIMDGFDMDESFKQHYYQNRRTIKSMCEQLGITTTWEPLLVFDEEGGFWNYIKSHESSKWQAATIMTILCALIGLCVYLCNSSYIYVDEMWGYVLWGTGIGAISWLCILYDQEDRKFNGEWLGAGGCYGCLIGIVLIGFYWIYKIIRLCIDGIKGA